VKFWIQNVLISNKSTESKDTVGGTDGDRADGVSVGKSASGGSIDSEGPGSGDARKIAQVISSNDGIVTLLEARDRVGLLVDDDVLEANSKSSASGVKSVGGSRVKSVGVGGDVLIEVSQAKSQAAISSGDETDTVNLDVGDTGLIGLQQGEQVRT
jgi:hypothetical protein